MIFCVAPNAVHISGGVGVLANWVRLLNQHGHSAMLITPNGDPSPYWLNFQVPTGSYSDIIDTPEHKRVDIWMDCMVENPRKAIQGYFFAQDVCQLEHIKSERGGHAYLLALRHLQLTNLITITHHAHWYYLYRYGIQSKIVNNFVDTDLFRPGEKNPNWVAMVKHRDHYNPEIHQALEKAGFQVQIAQGGQEEIARVLAQCLFFVSDVRGRWDGFEYSEGMPMPIMEALASGCLCFGRDINGVRELVRQQGTTFDSLDDLSRMMHPYLPTLPIFRYTEGKTWTQIQEALELT